MSWVWCGCPKCGTMFQFDVDLEREPPNLLTHPRECRNCRHVHVRDRVNCPGQVWSCMKYGDGYGRFVHGDWSCDSWELSNKKPSDAG